MKPTLIDLDAALSPAPERTELDLLKLPAREGAPSTHRSVVKPSRLRRLPAWVAVLAGDLVGLLAPAGFVQHGRVELAAAACLSILSFKISGLYRPQLRLSALDDAPKLAARSTACALLVGGLTAVIGYPPVLLTFVTIGAVAVVAQVFMRSATYAFIRRARTSGRFAHQALLLGTGAVARRVAERLINDPSYGLRLIGYVGRRAETHAGSGIPYLGRVDALPTVCARTGLSVVIVAYGDETEDEIVRALRAPECADREVFVVPRLFELHNYGQSDHVGAVPVVRLPRRGQRASARLVKRTIDVVVSSIALVACLPLLLLAAIAVRIEGGGGVIFRQARIGRGGREFQLLKFRSLKPLDESESETRWSVSHDDRIGPVGRLLRRTSIDELPQLFNILRGDMTLVGPRPERPHFVKAFTEQVPEYRDRHRVPVGLTGLAQVSGLRGDTSIEDRARYDNFYIDNWSLWLDFKIMITTARELIGARGQ